MVVMCTKGRNVLNKTREEEGSVYVNNAGLKKEK